MHNPKQMSGDKRSNYLLKVWSSNSSYIYITDVLTKLQMQKNFENKTKKVYE